MIIVNDETEKKEFITIKQKLNGYGSSGVSLILFTLVVMIFLYYSQVQSLEAFSRSLRLGFKPNEVEDFTMAYLICGAINLVGWVLLIIGRDFIYPKD